jgi:amidase
MHRREFLATTAFAGTALTLNGKQTVLPGTPADAPGIQSPAFVLEEATVSDLRARMKKREITSEDMVELYLERIEQIDRQGPALRSVLEINPDALGIARTLDAEHRSKGPRSPLHGIPVLLKDNIETADKMQTTAGSLALLNAPTPQDSWVAERLRAAGAIILGKTNMSEWANFRSTHSTSGWSARGGQTRNPYALDRNPSGSSSGSGVAVSANLCTMAVGTETDGSVIGPSSMNGIVGIKPTLGLISRRGIIPIAHSQDTAGPMARTVRDAAILLGALTGIDPRDATTNSGGGKVYGDYTRFLDRRGLKGARIGIARQYFNIGPTVTAVMQESIDLMRKEGAQIVDPADLSTFEAWRDTETTVLLYEFKSDLNRYLAGRGGWPIASLSIATIAVKRCRSFNKN